MASTSRGAFFGNVVDPQPAILSKKNELRCKYLSIGLCTF